VDGHPIVAVIRPYLVGLDLSEVTVQVSWPEGENGLEKPVQVTVSIGVASLGPDTRRVDELVARADAALYAAKRTGKDRVQAS